jgi:type I restriction enzyme M protein
MQEPSKDNSGDKIYVTENYVTWSSYSYKTIKTIIRKSDNTVLSEEEYNNVIDKNNYLKNVKEVLYVKKLDGTVVSEEKYSKKKSDYKKKTIYEYERISDGVVVSEDEYKELTKKSAYKITIETLTLVEEHKKEDGSTRYIKDLFVEEHGTINEHKKWIQENSRYVLKNNDVSYSETITIDEKSV